MPQQGRLLCSIIGILFTALLAVNASGQNLGVIGPVYPIAEPSLLEVILSKLRQAESSGVLGQVQHDAQARMKRNVEHPEALSNVNKTTRARTHYYDPSLVVSDAVTDAEGKIIIAPGTRVNPLDIVTLSKHLLFFDARDADQLRLARTLLDRHHGQLKLILTGGSYLQLMRRWKLPVFFDQQGILTTKLRIQQVPALVYQEGRRLRIDEIL